MTYLHVFWDPDDDPKGNVQHVAEHGFTPDDVEHVLLNSWHKSKSNTGGWPAVWGYTPAGEYIIVVFEQIDTDTVYPITAYEVPEPN
jgi:hypothetical protein